MQIEAVSQLLPAGQAVVKDVLEGLILKYQAKRWEAARMRCAVELASKAVAKPSAAAQEETQSTRADGSELK